MSAPLRRSKRVRETLVSTGESLGEAQVSSTASTCDNASITFTSRKPRKYRKLDETAVSSEDADAVEGIQVARSNRPSRYVACRRGKLKLMTEMPIDTLHEVFRRLDPVDLLHLSWASKSLRALIMERSARYIWQEAFERLYASDNPPPRCPEDTDITRYTRFLFNKKCMMCGIRNGHWTSWEMRVRTCSNCFVDHFTEYPVARQRLTHQYLRKLPKIVKRREWYFLNRDIRDAAENECSDEKYKNRKQGLESFQSWEKGCLQSRIEKLDSIRLERKKAIFEKLEEMGWKQSDVESMASVCGMVLADLPGFGKAKKLTYREWQDIQPKLLECLGDLQELHKLSMKHRRSANHWLCFYQKFETWQIVQELPQSLLPHPADIAVLEPFRSTIFLSDAENVEFDVDGIDHTAKEWMRCRDALVFSLLPKDVQELYGVEDIQLSLHSLVVLRFSGPGSLTGTIDQVCASRQSLWHPGHLQDPDGAELCLMLGRHCDVAPWNCHSQDISFDTEAFEIGKDVITFLKLDPYTATFDDLIQSTRKFTCIGEHLWDCDSSELNGVEMLEHDLNMHEKNWTPAVERWDEA